MQMFSVDFNFGELWHANLHHWRIASGLDSTDLWGDGKPEEAIVADSLCAPFNFIETGVEAQISLMNKLCELILPLATKLTNLLTDHWQVHYLSKLYFLSPITFCWTKWCQVELNRNSRGKDRQKLQEL